MERDSKIIIGVFGVLFGVPALVAAGLIGFWFFSVTLQEKSYALLLASDFAPAEEYAAEKLLDYPSRDSALALVMFINLGGKTSGMEEAAARRALLSLALMSGEDFGTGLRGTRYNFEWDPPYGDYSWGMTIALVDWWAARTFGLEALGALNLGDAVMEIRGEEPGGAGEQAEEEEYAGEEEEEEETEE